MLKICIRFCRASGSRNRPDEREALKRPGCACLPKTERSRFIRRLTTRVSRNRGLTDNDQHIERDEQYWQIRALEVVAVAAAGRRRGRGDGGDSSVRDMAVQRADSGRRQMVLLAAPLVAVGDGGCD